MFPLPRWLASSESWLSSSIAQCSTQVGWKQVFASHQLFLYLLVGKMLLFASYQHFLYLLIISVTVAGCPSPRPDHSQHTPALQVGDQHHVIISTMSILTIRMSIINDVNIYHAQHDQLLKVAVSSSPFIGHHHIIWSVDGRRRTGEVLPVIVSCKSALS